MSFNAQNTEKKQRPIASVGAHPAICYSIIDLGRHSKSYQGKEPKEVNLVQFSWEFPNLPHAIFKEGEAAKPLAIFQEYTVSLDGRSKLFQTLSAWRGVPPVDLAKELPNFLGQACLINVVHAKDKQRADITYANIAGSGVGIMRMPQGMQVNPLINQKMFFNLDKYSHAEFLKLPTWIQNKIQSSLEWSGIVAKFGPVPVVAQTSQPVQNQQPANNFQTPGQVNVITQSSPIITGVNGSTFDNDPPF